MLCVAIPLFRDLLLGGRPGSAALLAMAGYSALLLVCLLSIRWAGISWEEVGVGAVTARSLAVGIIAGTFVVAPVWRLPVISISGGSWIIIAVAIEEVAFRGVLFALLRRACGLPIAIVGSALLFTVAHAGSAGLPSLALVGFAGLYLGLLRSIRGDLWTCGLAHLVMDLVSLP
jgi:membrane protease YdiL (CAAX protease family)